MAITLDASLIAAAILLGLVRWFGPGPLAILLGTIALGGLVAQAVGVEAPPMAIFFWWILLILYLLLGFVFSATSSKETAYRLMEPASEVVILIRRNTFL